MEVAGSAVDQFDSSSASTLFWENVPVLLQRADRDDQVEELSVRVLSGHTRHNHNMRVLRIHLSNDEDLFFLHTLEVSEEDFQTLKIEQGILVDFSSFSGKIIDLLKRCIASRSEELARFRAVLVLRAGESTFKMVETNDFKQLPHITLSFRPGNDMAIKSFLAFRLKEMSTDCERLEQSLHACQARLQATNTDLDSNREAFFKMQSEHQRMLMEAESAAKSAAAAAHEERVREREELHEASERLRRGLEEKHAQQVENLQQRVDALDKENRELRDQKYALDCRVSELSHKFGSAEGQLKAFQEEVARLQKQLQAVSRDKTDADVQLSDVRAKLASSQEKLALQESLAKQQAERLQEMEASSRLLETRCSELKEASAGHEQRAKEASAEVAKGNHIIEKLTGDLQTNKEKLKRKQAVLVRQEDELQARDRALEAAEREISALKRTLEAVHQEQARLADANDELRTKLEDSKQQLKGNEQMIRWLNAQVNEAQLAAARPSSTATRFNFRPALAAPTPVDTPTLTYSRPTFSSSTPVPRTQSGTASASTAIPFKPYNAQSPRMPQTAVTSSAKFQGFGSLAPHTMPGSASPHLH